MKEGIDLEHKYLDRFWIDEKKWSSLRVDRKIEIEEDLFKHIFIVRRLRKEKHILLFSSFSEAYVCSIDDLSKRKAVVSVVRAIELQPTIKPYFYLNLCAPRVETLEKLLPKMVELGVQGVRLLSSDNCFIKDKFIYEKKRLRLEKILKSAYEQSLRFEPMVLNLDLEPLDMALEKSNKSNQSILFFYEHEKQRTYLDAIHEIGELKPESLGVYIGSEGGFSEGEVNHLRQMGHKPIGLGQQVLRVETACTAVIGALAFNMRR